MTLDDDIMSPDPETRASALIERAIDAEMAGRHDEAKSDLEEAERIAAEDGLNGLLVAARINRGWAAFNHGDAEEAVRLYQEAAELARERQDFERLRPALGNLAVALRSLTRYEEAAAAYDDFLQFTEGDSEAAVMAHIDRAICLIEIGGFEEATFALEKAEALAIEAGLDTLLLEVHLAQGVSYARNFDPGVAATMYLKAAKAARDLGEQERLLVALGGIAEAHRELGQYGDTDAVYTEIETIQRAAGDRSGLADAMYWHAQSLQQMGSQDRALALWREEEVLRRELGQDQDLGDNLLAQAAVHRVRRETDPLPRLYEEAEAAYRRAGALNGVADALYWRSMALRRNGKSEEARALAEQILEIAEQVKYPSMQIFAWGLHAMTLADAGETAVAYEDLDRADESSYFLGADNLAIWMFARRAYVMARDDKPAEEIVSQLRKAYEHAVNAGLVSIGRTAVRAMSAEIKARCGDGYSDALDALQDEIVSDWRTLEPPGEG